MLLFLEIVARVGIVLVAWLTIALVGFWIWKRKQKGPK
jgi:hypothetical protein